MDSTRGLMTSIIGLFGVALLVFGGHVVAQPLDNSAYRTDAQTTYADDLLGDHVDLINDILCHYRNSLASQQATGEPYVALIDSGRCSGVTAKGAKAYDEGQTAVEYHRGRLNVTGDDDQLSGDAHWILADESDKAWGKITVTAQADGEEVLTSDLLIDEPGFEKVHSMQTSGDTTAFLFESTDDSDPDLDGRGYILAEPETDSGKGFIELTSNGSTTEWAFGYNSEYYCRMDGSDTYCFDRAASEAHASVWSYRLYEPDGSRFERGESGRPGMSLRLQGGDEWGWIDYSGVWFPQDALTDLSDRQIVTNENDESYTLNYLRYRLDKYEDQRGFELEEISQIPFWVWLDGDSSEDQFDMELYWDNEQGEFVVTGYDPTQELNFKDPDGFDDVQSTYTAPELAEKLGVDTDGSEAEFYAWNFLLNSNLILVFGNGGDLVEVRSDDRTSLQSSDVGLEDGTKLYCFSICVTKADIDAYETDVNNNTEPTYPFFDPSNGSAPLEYTVRYDPYFVLLDPDGEKVEWPASVEPEDPDSGGGRMDLYESSSSVPGTDSPDYALELGIGYDSYVLEESGETVEFVEPLQVKFDVPQDARKQGGTTMILQVEGEEIRVPGSCYDPVDNEPAECDGDTEWRHNFVIPADPEVGRVTFIDDPQKELLVKWIEREVALNPVSSSGLVSELEFGDPGGMVEAIGDLTLCNPSNQEADCYIGEFPTDAQMEESPIVIHGERVSSNN